MCIEQGLGENAKINLNDTMCIGTEIRSVTARNWEWDKGIVLRETQGRTLGFDGKTLLLHCGNG